MARLQPGFAFSLVCDLGFAVGLMTHHVDRIGDLVWMAGPVFEEEPTIEDVEKIEDWRWPIFFPLGAAVRRRIVTSIGVVTVPAELRAFPVMRSGDKKLGWVAFTREDRAERLLGPATDPALPIYEVVNDTRLKEMLVSGWRPEQEW
jgi:hypothetical protein